MNFCPVFVMTMESLFLASALHSMFRRFCYGKHNKNALCAKNTQTMSVYFNFALKALVVMRKKSDAALSKGQRMRKVYRIALYTINHFHRL